MRLRGDHVGILNRIRLLGKRWAGLTRSRSRPLLHAWTPESSWPSRSRLSARACERSASSTATRGYAANGRSALKRVGHRTRRSAVPSGSEAAAYSPTRTGHLRRGSTPAVFSDGRDRFRLSPESVWPFISHSVSSTTIPPTETYAPGGFARWRGAPLQRHRRGGGRDPAYSDLEARLPQVPAIRVPILVIHGLSESGRRAAIVTTPAGEACRSRWS